MTQKQHHPYEEEGFDVLCNAGEQMKADILLDELHAAGIRAIQYPGETMSALNYPPLATSGGILILVPNEQMEEARALYAELESASEESEEPA